MFVSLKLCQMIDMWATFVLIKEEHFDGDYLATQGQELNPDDVPRLFYGKRKLPVPDMKN